MNADRVIKSNAEFFNIRTWAGDTQRRNAISARGDDVEVTIGSGSVEERLAESGMPQNHGLIT